MSLNNITEKYVRLFFFAEKQRVMQDFAETAKIIAATGETFIFQKLIHIY